ncbi:MAG: hypothetical protein A2W91_02715 [Bacteroidetes bacterium GWF2_38_335]|nr:MAG: hypothetical protein A2W91_02715 [Bacteroidetes bacterium GWF2_38_335]OFY77593.1 MAG: hypothetical protein A2281_02045 [Bacteroidetes bacterium RIFOXYA12_FULL_38_20]HBS87105.1 hypothetical protein [Bacteroidales bacterium]
MDHGPAVKLGVDHAQKKKQRLGVWLFIVYTVVYAIFVAIALTNFELMAKPALGNQNLAIVFGFGLIVLAVIMGLIYNWVCTGYENKMNKEDKS